MWSRYYGDSCFYFKRKSKFKIFNVHAFECSGLEEYLEREALKGWKLKSIFRNCLKFIKIQPQKLVYSVEALNDVIPINTDEKCKFEKIKKTSLKSILLQLLLAIILTFNLSIQTVISLNPYVISSNSIVILGLLVFMLDAITAVDIIRYIKFIIKGKRSLDIGEEVEYSNYKALNFKRSFYYIYMFIAIIALLVLLIDEAGIGSNIIGIWLVYGILLYGIWKWIGGKNYKRKRKQAILITSYILITFITLGTFIHMSSMDIFSQTKEEYHDNRILDILYGNFHGNNEKKEVYYKKNEGILGCYIFAQNDYIGYEEFSANYQWINKYYFNKSMKEYEKWERNYSKLNEYKDTGYEVYKNQDREEYIIHTKYKTIEIIIYDEDIDEEQVIKRVINI